MIAHSKITTYRANGVVIATVPAGQSHSAAWTATQKAARIHD
jgi:hypothetical protein